MSMETTILLIAAAGILLFSLVYTWMLGRQQKAVKGGIDSQIPHPVQEHAYLRNPVFLMYAIFFALVLIMVVIAAMTFGWY